MNTHILAISFAANAMACGAFTILGILLCLMSQGKQRKYTVIATAIVGIYTAGFFMVSRGPLADFWSFLRSGLPGFGNIDGVISMSAVGVTIISGLYFSWIFYRSQSWPALGAWLGATLIGIIWVKDAMITAHVLQAYDLVSGPALKYMKDAHLAFAFQVSWLMVVTGFLLLWDSQRHDFVGKLTHANFYPTYPISPK